MTSISIKENKGYLIAYIPFRCELNKEKNYESDVLVEKKTNTKLFIKQISNIISTKYANYCLYHKANINDIDSKVYLDLYENSKFYKNSYYTDEILLKAFKTKNYTNIDRDFNHGIPEETIENINTKFNLEDKNYASIENIDLSIFNDSKNIKLGFIKLIIRFDFPLSLKENKQINAITNVYSVLCRNLKQNFNGSNHLQFKFDYDGLSNYLNSLIIKFKGEDLHLSLNKDDIIFNIDDSQKRCYCFSYITVDNDIEKYVKISEKTLYSKLYNLSRIHENGDIRTYNINNNVSSIYSDDTSVIWGASKVGAGAICVQEKLNEQFRNIKVLNNDFSFIMEFVLHQKFFYYLTIDKNDYNNLSIFRRLIYKPDRYRSDMYNSFNMNYCPNVISELETQDIYDLLRDKLEVVKLLDDVKLTINSLKTERSNSVNRIINGVAILISIVLSPVVVLSYFNDLLVLGNQAGRLIVLIIFIFSIILNLLFYILTGQPRK